MTGITVRAAGRVLLSAAFAASLVAGLGQAQTGSPVTKLKYSSLGGATDAGVFLADAYGFFKEYGLEVTPVVQTSIPSQVAEAATNAIEVSGIALAPGLFASVQRAINLRLVGDKQSLRPGFSSTRLTVRPDLVKGSEAETIHGLRGKKIGGPGRTSIGYFLVAALFRKHGMSLSDFEYVEVQLPNMAAALASNAIDGALIIDPFLSRVVQTKLATVVSDLIEFVPDGGSIVPLVYSEQFAANRPVATNFMKAYVRGVRVYNDAISKGVDTQKVIEIIAKAANVPVPVIKDGFPAGLDPNQRLNKTFLGSVQHFYKEQGLLEKEANIDAMIDSSFSEAAVKELGEYR